MRQHMIGSGGMALIVAGILVANSVSADSALSRSRTSLFATQVSILDGRASEQYANSIDLQPPRAIVPTLWSEQYEGRYSGPYLDLARSAAQRHNVPEDLFLRLVQQESGWNDNAISPKGAIGLAQLMPDTANYLGVDPNNPTENLDGGARYLRQQYDTFGTWQLALAAYNAGPEAVRQYGDIPPYNETQNYVRVIWGS